MAGVSDNNGRPPGGGAPDDLPDLPEEWGVIVIPDDLSALADEVEAVRAELNTAEPATRWQRVLRRPAVRRLRRIGRFAVRTPALIISVAVMVTVASLFASAWPGPARQPATQRTSGTVDEPTTGALPATDLVGADGQSVSIRGHLPAVVLLTDGCDCGALIADTISAVSAETAVLVVTVSAVSASPSVLRPPAQTPRADGKSVTFLLDQTAGLRRHLRLGTPDGTAAVILVNSSGDIIRTWQRTASVEDIRPDLARL
ncbi:hypothetical protein [Actinoplanes sp. NBRC 101535]|uniref:hypothetical protein n=1 Tax=Actinoplanes sp. NBRC 101535 TaxID=3032196 RepID=UPI0024A188D8|nr:hypothetical protein [Actinoplanes sp. NBRC 101535]GLY08085.1 hypothetical protein Acsp01_84640 [Actinoplanes sp. NBRC 101535]